MYPFVYEAVIIADYTNYEPQTSYGVTFGENMAEAMKHIESYYGNDMQSCKVEYIGSEQEVIEIEPEWIDKIRDKIL